MSAYVPDAQSPDIIFGTPEGDHIRAQVLGVTCPDASSDWYRSQLDAEIHVNVGTFRGYRSLVMFSDDFPLFRAALKRLRTGAAAVAFLKAGDFLAVEVRADGSAYHVWMELDALEQDGELVACKDGAENWVWRIEMDHTSLDALTTAVKSVSDRYPTWSVPNY